MRNNEPRTFRVKTQFTAAERAKLARLAVLKGVTVAELLRRRALGNDGAPAEALALSSVDLVGRS
jgi:hypothetical protein